MTPFEAFLEITKLGGRDIDLEKIILKDRIIALQYAEFLVKRGIEVPREVIEVLIENPYVFIRYVEFLESVGLSISREYVDKFLESSGWVDLKAKFLASRDLAVPKYFLENAEFCYAYAKESISRGRSVPEDILKKASERSVDRILLAIYYIESGLEVPDMLVRGVAGDAFGFRMFLDNLLDKKLSLPDKFLDYLLYEDRVYMGRHIKFYLRKSYEKGVEIPEKHMEKIIYKAGSDIWDDIYINLFGGYSDFYFVRSKVFRKFILEYFFLLDVEGNVLKS